MGRQYDSRLDFAPQRMTVCCIEKDGTVHFRRHRQPNLFMMPMRSFCEIAKEIGK